MLPAALMLCGVLSASPEAPRDALAEPTPPAPIVETPAPRLVLGVEAFGEFFPRSSETVPSRPGVYQQSVLTGGRVTAGVRHSGVLRGLLVVEGGYAAAGLEAGNGQDGFMLGLGAEANWVPHDLFMLLLRLTADLKVIQWSTLRTGTLSEHALVFAAGVRFLRVVDLHVVMGSDFAGGISFGFGAGLGWQWSIEP